MNMNMTSNEIKTKIDQITAKYGLETVYTYTEERLLDHLAAHHKWSCCTNVGDSIRVHLTDDLDQGPDIIKPFLRYDCPTELSDMDLRLEIAREIQDLQRQIKLEKQPH